MIDETDARIAAEINRGARLFLAGEKLLEIADRLFAGARIDDEERRLARLATDFAADHPGVVETLIAETARIRTGFPSAEDFARIAHICDIDSPEAAAIRENLRQLVELDDAVDHQTATAN